MTRPLRIGLLTPGWPGEDTPNGIATAVFHLALGLRQIGCMPVILAQNIDGPCPEDIPVIPIPKLSWCLQERIPFRFGDGGALQRYAARRVSTATQTAIDTYGIDVLLMEETEGWAKHVQAAVQIPVFVALHGPWVTLQNISSLGPAEDARRVRRENAGYRAATGIVAPSRSVLEAAEKAAGGLDRTPKIVLPNCLPLADQTEVAACTPAERILFVGRCDAIKGADTVLAAMIRLIAGHPQARLTFVGPDPGITQPDGSRKHMPEFLAALPAGVRAKIDYLGRQPREEVARLRRDHPIALIASRFENLNYTLLEAMAAGQAIVSTAVGGPAEVLTDEETALMVPADHPRDMAAALERLLQDTDLRQNIGTAAQRELQRTFDPTVVAEQLRDFIDTVVRARSG